MPAASASSRVVVPPKPLRANSGIAASTILCRRSSLSSRVAAMMRKSKRSLTFGQYTGLRQKRRPKKRAKKDGRPPPEGRPISYVAMAVYPHIRPGCAPHAGGKVRHLAQRRNREIPDQQGYPRQSSLAPAVARTIPSLMHIPAMGAALLAPRFRAAALHFRRG